MLQDIFPHRFNNYYSPREPRANDYLVCCCGGEVLLKNKAEGLTIPKYSEVVAWWPELAGVSHNKDDQGSEFGGEGKESWAGSLQYLFAIDGRGFFLVQVTEGAAITEHLPADYAYHEGRSLTTLLPDWMAFGAATALHLAQWYAAHRYCGVCAAPLQPGSHERSLVCPECNRVEYPKIAPVVIVAITDGNKLLLTRAAEGPYQHYALVAGFVEIGETLEEAAEREVREEVGLEIRNIRYYKSQPWAFSESLLMGLFADVKGDPAVTLRDKELSEATWFERQDIPVGDNTTSLTGDMIQAFKTERNPC